MSSHPPVHRIAADDGTMCGIGVDDLTPRWILGTWNGVTCAACLAIGLQQGLITPEDVASGFKRDRKASRSVKTKREEKHHGK